MAVFSRSLLFVACCLVLGCSDPQSEARSAASSPDAAPEPTPADARSAVDVAAGATTTASEMETPAGAPMPATSGTAARAGTAPATPSVPERAVLSPQGGLGPDTDRVMRGDGFAVFLSDLKSGTTSSKARSRTQAYRGAIEQTLSEIDGAAPPVDFECGPTVCAGTLEASADNSWLGEWQARVMKEQLAPISAMAVREIKAPDGTVQNRFVFTTSGPGRVVAPIR